MEIETKEVLHVQEMPLADWLQLVFNPPSDKVFVRTAFPTDQHREQYLSAIDERSEDEVRKLLQVFLVHSGTFELNDQLALSALIAAKTDNPDLFSAMLTSSYYQRLVLFASGKSQPFPWEGITWILDLLPHFPKEAIGALSGYILANAQFLPDWRYSGLCDAVQIIRAKFIGTPSTNSGALAILNSLSPRDFEHIVERVFHSLGYKTHLTPPSRDGGRDIVAQKDGVSQRECVLVECKLYSHPVGVSIARSLLGVVSSEKVNKGVVVTSARFTKDAHKFVADNPRLELIDGHALLILMNEQWGTKWPIRIDQYILDSKKLTQPNDQHDHIEA